MDRENLLQLVFCSMYKYALIDCFLNFIFILVDVVNVNYV